MKATGEAGAIRLRALREEKDNMGDYLLPRIERTEKSNPNNGHSARCCCLHCINHKRCKANRAEKKKLELIAKTGSLCVDCNPDCRSFDVCMKSLKIAAKQKWWVRALKWIMR